jgi:hypothetical protein
MTAEDSMKNRSISQQHFLLLFSASAALAIGCNEGSSKPSDGSPSTVADTLMELSRGLNACAETQKACADQADAGADLCRDGFAECREAAHAELGPKLDNAVNDCASAARTCRDAATTEEAKAACGDQLRACTGSDKVKPEADAGEEERVSKAPVADCIDSLHSCIEGDAPAKSCTDALRVCIGAAVGGGSDADAGKPDAGKPDGVGNPDAGKPGDVGKPDGGDQGKPDGGEAKPDAGNGFDAGKPVDTGKPDGGVDQGNPDAGMAGESAACKQAFDQCVTAGGTREDCARARRDCRE